MTQTQTLNDRSRQAQTAVEEAETRIEALVAERVTVRSAGFREDLL